MKIIVCLALLALSVSSRSFVSDMIVTDSNSDLEHYMYSFLAEGFGL